MGELRPAGMAASTRDVGRRFGSAPAAASAGALPARSHPAASNSGTEASASSRLLVELDVEMAILHRRCRKKGRAMTFTRTILIAAAVSASPSPASAQVTALNPTTMMGYAGTAAAHKQMR